MSRHFRRFTKLKMETEHPTPKNEIKVVDSYTLHLIIKSEVIILDNRPEIWNVLSEYKFHIKTTRQTKWVVTRIYDSLKRRQFMLYLHRLVYDWTKCLVPSGHKVVHTNKNRFDCRLHNLELKKDAVRVSKRSNTVDMLYDEHYHNELEEEADEVKEQYGIVRRPRKREWVVTHNGFPRVFRDSDYRGLFTASKMAAVRWAEIVAST